MGLYLSIALYFYGSLSLWASISMGLYLSRRIETHRSNTNTLIKTFLFHRRCEPLVLNPETESAEYNSAIVSFHYLHGVCFPCSAIQGCSGYQSFRGHLCDIELFIRFTSFAEFFGSVTARGYRRPTEQRSAHRQQDVTLRDSGHKAYGQDSTKKKILQFFTSMLLVTSYFHQKTLQMQHILNIQQAITECTHAGGHTAKKKKKSPGANHTSRSSNDVSLQLIGGKHMFE